MGMSGVEIVGLETETGGGTARGQIKSLKYLLW